ncbi:MAG: hypothetical protein R3190_06900 [Thermoanaerobaculia bacterium]|nr:hypothetical protein [Thermoanaerobaculia bacterium]
MTHGGHQAGQGSDIFGSARARTGWLHFLRRALTFGLAGRAVPKPSAAPNPIRSAAAREAEPRHPTEAEAEAPAADRVEAEPAPELPPERPPEAEPIQPENEAAGPDPPTPPPPAAPLPSSLPPGENEDLPFAELIRRMRESERGLHEAGEDGE